MTAPAALFPADHIGEPRPRDFRAAFARDGRGIAGQRRNRRATGRSALALLAAVAVPAVAAPEEWRAFQVGDAGARTVAVEPMPFERAGDSFPGSAFYYLAPDAPRLDAGVRSDADLPEDAVAGPVARPLMVDNSGIDRTRALQCLTAAIYYEAASEPDSGQRAVAQVVLNRVAHPAYPKSVCGVVYQGSERRTGCQFTFTCDGSLARAPSRMFWLRAESVARDALAGYVHAPVGLATHYHTVAVSPYWAPSLSYIGTIGAHRFYRFAGRAGQPSAFRFAYLGGEPVAAPHPRSADAPDRPDPALDPLAIERAFAVFPTAAPAAQAPAQRSAAPAYAPALELRGGDALYRGDGLPQGSGVRPEYETSGRWIARPGA